MQNVSCRSYAQSRTNHRSLQSNNTSNHHDGFNPTHRVAFASLRSVGNAYKNQRQPEKHHRQTETDNFRRGFWVLSLPFGSLFHKSLFCRHIVILLLYGIYVNCLSARFGSLSLYLSDFYFLICVPSASHLRNAQNNRGNPSPKVITVKNK